MAKRNIPIISERKLKKHLGEFVELNDKDWGRLVEYRGKLEVDCGYRIPIRGGENITVLDMNNKSTCREKESDSEITVIMLQESQYMVPPNIYKRN